MQSEIPSSWKQQLSAEFEKPYFKNLTKFVAAEYSATTCYPPESQIFAAFEQCSFDDVRVVIIGQDPYHGANQAHGLCFSVNDGIAFPPSLRNIFEEIRRDIGKEITGGNLQRWASQGVLLLNATLTVREANAGSHQKQGWEKLTDAVIEVVSKNKSNVVFMLWGGYAKKKGANIDKTKHLVLESGHPSPLSANKGHWFGNKHFSKANEYLQNHHLQPIEW